MLECAYTSQLPSFQLSGKKNSTHKELFRLNVDIAAFSKTHLLEEESLTESHYTFYWKGRSANSNSIHGVGFTNRNTLVPKFGQLPQRISERLMLLRYPVSDGNTVNLTSAYAVTLDSAHEVKEIKTGRIYSQNPQS